MIRRLESEREKEHRAGGAPARDTRGLGSFSFPEPLAGQKRGAMLHKEFLKPSQRVRVTFELPGSIWATCVALVGDFNDWDPCRHVMQQRGDGTWTIAVELAAGRSYEFRYLIDGTQSSAEWSADGLTSQCGTTNSILVT